MRVRSSSVGRVLGAAMLALGVAVVFSAVGSRPAAAEEQQGPGQITIDHLPGPKLSPFDHPAHTGRAKCGDCHHAGENAACGSSGCHPSKAPAGAKAPGVKRAFHKQCIPCHARNKASTKCTGACHPS